MACPKLCSWVWPLPTLVQQAAHQSAPHRCVAHYRETTATEAAAVVGRDGAVVMPWPNWNLISKPNIWASWVYHSRYRWEIWTMFAVNISKIHIDILTFDIGRWFGRPWTMLGIRYSHPGSGNTKTGDIYTVIFPKKLWVWYRNVLGVLSPVRLGFGLSHRQLAHEGISQLRFQDGTAAWSRDEFRSEKHNQVWKSRGFHYRKYQQ